MGRVAVLAVASASLCIVVATGSVAETPLHPVATGSCGDDRIPIRIVGRSPEHLTGTSIGVVQITPKDSQMAGIFAMQDGLAAQKKADATSRYFSAHPPPTPQSRRAEPLAMPVQAILRGDSFTCGGLSTGSYVVRLSLEKIRSAMVNGQRRTVMVPTIYEGSLVVPHVDPHGRVLVVRVFGFRREPTPVVL